MQSPVPDTPMPPEIEGQLSTAERQILSDSILKAAQPPQVVIEVGTWLGGGSTLHLLRALEKRGAGHLWGIEADRSIYERMVASIRQAAPEAAHRFTPLFGFSQDVIPAWLAEQKAGFQIDIAFLDGANNPAEQITEFRLLDPFMPVGAQVMGHDAKLRKGKWLVPYVSLLDNWEAKLHDVSLEGLFHARKVAALPSKESLLRANSRLRRLRLQPKEIAAAILPSWVCGAVLRCLPRKFSEQLSGYQ